MRRVLLLTLVLAVLRCAAPPPVETVPEVPAAAVSAPVVEETVTGAVHVTASALNVRSDASTESEVIAQVKRGTRFGVLRSDESWTKVRLADGTSGWVASRFVAREGDKKARASSTKKSRDGCPPDSDFAFTETPTLAFSDSGAKGMVVVDATVNTRGVVTGTKILSNSTGDGALAFLAEREIKSAKFSPPIRGCVPRTFIFTYKRTF